MFDGTADERLTSWAAHRRELEKTEEPYQYVWDFWKHAPYIPYNNKIDPFYQRGWPTPWEIIVDNKYDDFTKSLMIGWTLKLTERFKKSKIELRTLVDKSKQSVYTIVVVEDKIALNYNDNGPILVLDIPDSFLVENIIELKRPR